MFNWLNERGPREWTRWEEVEARLVQYALHHTGSKLAAARWLGISRERIRIKCHRYKLNFDRPRMGFSVRAKKAPAGPRRPTAPSVLRLLEFFGIDGLRGPMNYKLGARRPPSNFWHRHADDLPAILARARRAYLAAMKSAHPDKGGHHADAALLAEKWRRLSRLFASHGVTT